MFSSSLPIFLLHLLRYVITFYVWIVNVDRVVETLKALESVQQVTCMSHILGVLVPTSVEVES